MSSAQLAMNRPAELQRHLPPDLVTLLVRAAPVAAALLLMCALEWAAGAGLLPISIPAPSAVARAFVKDRAIILEHLLPTLSVTAAGFAVALLVSFALAILAGLFRRATTGIYNSAVVIQAMPLIALAPILIIWLGNGLAPRIVIAALASFFPILVGLVQGMRASEKGAAELFSVLAASRWQRLSILTLPTALPFVFSGLKVAAASAVLGAIIAEWTGATRGIGTMMAYAMYSFRIEQVWVTVIVAILMALAAYGLVRIAERKFVSWEAPSLFGTESEATKPLTLRGTLMTFGWMTLAVACGVGLWLAIIGAFKVPPYLLPSPAMTWQAFSAMPMTFFTDLGYTLRAAFAGTLVSLVCAVATAMAFVQFPIVERICMPFVIAVRSAPMVAIAPLITLMVGRNLFAGIVVVWLATFFPILVNVVRGLQSARSTHLELMHLNAASTWQVFRFVRLPFSLPHMFAGIRIAAPKAVLAAMLSEWLTGARGIGHLIVESSAMMELPTLWAGILLSIAAGLAVFWLTAALERWAQP